MIIKTLENGIRLVEVPLKGLHGVSVEVFVKIGSKYEKEGEHGMSHFLEHMAFKGTEKRASATIINNEIDSKGANYNAGTGHEYTSYYITTAGENMEWSFEILSDILLHSVYRFDDIKKERGVIAEEIKMYDDNPMMGLSGEFTKFLYGKSPIGCWDISGRVEEIMKVDRNKVIDFNKKFWNPKEMVLVVAGNIDKKTEEYARKYFGHFYNKKSQALPLVDLFLNEEKEYVRRKEVEQGHFCLGVPAISRKDKRRYAFKLLDTILTGNTSSRLYTKIREEKGWAYYVFSISDSFEEGGFWGVQSGVKEDKLDEAIELTEKELLELKDNFREEELIRAKEYLNGKMRLGEDRSEFWAAFVGQQLLFEKEIRSVNEELKALYKVSLEEVKELAESIFSRNEIRKVSVRRK